MPTKITASFLLGVLFLFGALLVKAQSAAIQRPLKIDVVPVQQRNPAGQAVPVEVQLKNAAGDPVNANAPVTAVVETKQASGEITSTTVIIPPGESTKQVDLPAGTPGVTKMTVKEEKEQLIGGTNYMLIAPPATRAPSKKAAHKKKHPSKSIGHGERPPTSQLFPLRLPHPRLLLTAYAPQDPQPSFASTGPDDVPQLMLAVAGENDANNVRADGTAFARVKIFYLGPALPQKDIQVWLQWSNGKIDHNPIVVDKKTGVGQARWTSQFPIPAASLKVVATNPTNLPFASSKEATIKFSQPIVYIRLINPPDRITVVDRVNLTGGFYDKADTLLQVESQRQVHFDVNSPILKLDPNQSDVAPGAFQFSTVVSPTFVGKALIEASTPNYPPASHQVTVTYVGALLLCIAGGILGGFLAFVNSQGKLWIRITTGIVVGLFASWAYVIVGLPKTDSAILHNELSVLFISLAAALGGVKALAGVFKALNLTFSF
jgi:hypothetical protein